MSESTVEQLVEAAKAPTKFSIISVLQERAYPTEEVIVYLDEQTAYKAYAVEAELKADKEKIDFDEELEKRISDNEAKLEKLMSKMAESRYVFTIKGIPEGKREELLLAAEAKFPVEYEEEKNPFTGETKRVEIENRERNRLFTNMLWSANIEKITAPDGAIQENISLEEISEIRAALPLAAIGALNESIEKIRAATAVFLYSVDEDFLAKS